MIQKWAMAAAALAASAVCVPAWSGTLKPTDIRQNLFSNCFLGEQEGWLVGELGRVLHTTDGGKTFTRSETNTKDVFTSIVCFPDKTLIVVGQRGTALRSRDGGATWTTLKTGTDRNLLSVAFVNPKLGIAVGDYGTILRTEDGGDTWETHPVPEKLVLAEEVAETISPGDILLYDVDFGTPERAWIVGEFGVILASSDGGKNWEAQTGGVETTLFGTEFTDDQRGWAVGIESVMLRTTDGGATWTQENIPAPKGLFLSVYDVAVNGNHAIAIGDSGLLLMSSDAGQTWRQVSLPIELAGSWFRGVSMTPSGMAFAVGGDGLMLIAHRDKIERPGHRSVSH